MKEMIHLHACKMMTRVSVPLPTVIIMAEGKGQTRNWLIIASLPAGNSHYKVYKDTEEKF
jgi:hypothetical protein